jgi:hypothetical protein
VRWAAPTTAPACSATSSSWLLDNTGLSGGIFAPRFWSAPNGACCDERDMHPMRTFARTVALAGLMILGACSSTSSTGGNAGAGPKCTCGTLATAVNGCQHPMCMQGKTNPDNPKCHCGPITATKPANGDK